MLIKYHNGFCVKFDETLHSNICKMAEKHVDGTNYREHIIFPPLYDQF